MGVWSGPSHRDPETPQIEYCDLCGAPVGAADRIRAISQGLRDRWLCPEHEEYAFSLSFQDRGSTSQAPVVDYPDEEHSGLNPFETALED